MFRTKHLGNVNIRVSKLLKHYAPFIINKDVYNWALLINQTLIIQQHYNFDGPICFTNCFTNLYSDNIKRLYSLRNIEHTVTIDGDVVYGVNDIIDIRCITETVNMVENNIYIKTPYVDLDGIAWETRKVYGNLNLIFDKKECEKVLCQVPAKH